MKRVDSPCFCGSTDGYVINPFKDELYCEACGFTMQRSLVVMGPAAMKDAFINYRRTLEAEQRKRSDPMNQLPSRYQ